VNKRIWIVISLALFFLLPLRIFAQSCPDVEHNPCGNNDTECLQRVVDSCQSQASTLTGEINYMDNQIKLIRFWMRFISLKQKCSGLREF
jgi:hypothetical protein